MHCTARKTVHPFVPADAWLGTNHCDTHNTPPHKSYTPTHLCLLVHCWVPITVIEDDRVSTSQVDAHTSTACRQDEHKVLGICVEALHHDLHKESTAHHQKTYSMREHNTSTQSTWGCVEALHHRLHSTAQHCILPAHQRKVCDTPRVHSISLISIECRLMKPDVQLLSVQHHTEHPLGQRAHSPPVEPLVLLIHPGACRCGRED